MLDHLYRLLFFETPPEDAAVNWLPCFPYLSPIASVFALTVGVVAVWLLVRFVYLRMEPDYVGPRRKKLLSALRGAGLLLVLFMITGACLGLSRQTTSNGVLAVLFDTSASMSIADPRTDAEDVRHAARWLGFNENSLTPAERKSIDSAARFDLVTAALDRNNADMLRKLAERFELRFFTFGQHTEATPVEIDFSAREPLAGIGTPDQNESRLGDALRDVGRRLRGQYIAAVVPITDGGHNRGEDPRAVLPELGAPIYPVGIGLSNTRDIELKFMMMEDVIFKGDRFPVTLHIRHNGFAGRTTEISIRRDELPVHTENITFGEEQEFTQVVELEADKAGTFTFEAEIMPLPDEVTPRNNIRRRYEVRVVEEPLRVLVVEDRPRWEWRFLKTALDADKERVRAHHLLFAADRRVAQQRPDMLLRFPEDAEALRHYNLVIIGDVSPDLFTRKEQALLEEHIRVDGGWAILVAGRNHMPNAYANTLLADIMPVEAAGTPLVGTGRPIIEGVRPTLTEAGRTYPLLRLAADQDESNSLWRRVPPLYWFYHAPRVKPGAETLMEAPAGDEMMPLIVHQRYGAGQVLYIGTDETWRWRKLPGGEHHRRLWSQIVTQTGLDHVMTEQGKGRVQIETASREVALGSETVVMATVLGIDNRPLNAQQINAVASSPDKRQTTVVLAAQAGRKGVFSGPWTPTALGKHRLYVDDLENEGEWDVNVVSPQIEFDQPALRADLLAALAEQSGGRYIPPSEIDDMDQILADLEPLVRIQRREKTVWNAPGLLILITMLFGLELVLRKKWDLL